MKEGNKIDKAIVKIVDAIADEILNLLVLLL